MEERPLKGLVALSRLLVVHVFKAREHLREVAFNLFEWHERVVESVLIQLVLKRSSFK